MTRQRKDPRLTWPEPDRELFGIGLRTTSRREHKRSTSSLSEVYLAGIEQDYTQSLKWLTQRHLLDSNTKPSLRWPDETLNLMIDEMLPEYSVATVRTRVGRLKRALNIMEPKTDLSRFDQALREIGPAKPAFRSIVYEVSTADLMQYGIDLMNEAERDESLLELIRADLYQSGLQISLLALRPWRKGVYIAMELWKHLERVGDGFRMSARANETKQRRYQSAFIPESLKTYMERYLTHFRVVLLQGRFGESALWINKKGKPQKAGTFYTVFCRLTRQRFGKHINPQLVRKIAATTMAVSNPKHVAAIQGILGHTKLSTGEKYYNLANSIAAFQQLGDTIDGLIKESRQKRRLSRGRSTG